MIQTSLKCRGLLLGIICTFNIGGGGGGGYIDIFIHS